MEYIVRDVEFRNLDQVGRISLHAAFSRGLSHRRAGGTGDRRGRYHRPQLVCGAR